MKKTAILATCLAFIYSCNIHKKGIGSSAKVVQPSVSVKVDSVKSPVIEEIPIYRATETRVNDILHTKLDVRFDWEKAQLNGKATLTVKPYFYSADKLDLDAKGFDIHEVSLVKGNEKQKLDYDYRDNQFLSIRLDRTYKKEETYTVFIDYTAKPNELKNTGSAAIAGDKGLYFINPDGTDRKKPQQIWTQGETQDNSGWFPTIDKPNERMTQELCMTVDKRFVTLSNGEISYSTDNPNDTRTDCWKMDLPHAPYLVMMAVGEYAVVKDKWKDKEVNYYVEKEYEPHAKAIFGNTPEMLEFYSNKLGVSYPWAKYSQVVVRDYVSGAMENTTATIHGEFLQSTDRELLDNNHENVIAHEAFHQWFGNLVTCESWSNLPLNESFATYGEYLWEEYKYGRDAADESLQNDLFAYLQDARGKKKDLIRFDYNDKEDMFDAHSYQKGGRVLHMLRKYVGDEAFFASLKLYLEKNKYKTVEIHDLRLAFEEVTGEDLNWFFNQWFLSGGHPHLVIKHAYDEPAKKYMLTVNQEQNREKTPLYKLPMEVDIYTAGVKQRHSIMLTKSSQDFVFDVASNPDLVNVDAEKMLLCTKEEKKPVTEWIFQYKNAPLYLDRYEALEALGENMNDSLAAETVLLALEDKYHGLREYAIDLLLKEKSDRIKEALKKIAVSDPKTIVRARAIAALSRNYEDDELMQIYRSGVNEKSYAIVRQSVSAIARRDTAEGMKLAARFESEDKGGLVLVVADIYARHGNDENNSFFIRAFDIVSGYEQLGLINLYLAFLKDRKDEIINEAIPVFEKLAKEGSNRWVKLSGKRALSQLQKIYSDRQEAANRKINEIKSADPNAAEISDREKEAEQAKVQAQKIKAVIDSIQ